MFQKYNNAKGYKCPNYAYSKKLISVCSVCHLFPQTADCFIATHIHFFVTFHFDYFVGELFISKLYLCYNTYRQASCSRITYLYYIWYLILSVARIFFLHSIPFKRHCARNKNKAFTYYFTHITLDTCDLRCMMPVKCQCHLKFDIFIIGGCEERQPKKYFGIGFAVRWVFGIQQLKRDRNNQPKAESTHAKRKNQKKKQTTRKFPN